MLHPIAIVGLKSNDWTRTFTVRIASITGYGIVNPDYRNVCGWRLGYVFKLKGVIGERNAVERRIYIFH